MALSKKDRLAEKREKAAGEKREVRLDPRFPFQVRGFDPGFFGITRETRKREG